MDKCTLKNTDVLDESDLQIGRRPENIFFSLARLVYKRLSCL